MTRFMAIAAALLLPALACAGPAQSGPQPGPHAGDTYQIAIDTESVQSTSDGSSSGSSSDRDAVMERVIAVRDTGLELEFDLPASATADDRARSWQFPARVFKPVHGPMTLLNRPELEARLDRWLKDANWPRTVCGHWIFTWNAFRIECDPLSVIKTIEGFDLGHDSLQDGTPWLDPLARGPAPLRVEPDGRTFIAHLVVDPDVVRRGEAETDVATGEILGKPVTLDAARRARAAEDVSGTITVTLEADSTGQARRRTRVVKLQTKKPGGRLETNTVTETVERRPLVSQYDS